MRGERVANVYGADGRIPYVVPVTEERAAYNEVLSMYKGAVDPVAILPSQLRSEMVLTGSSSSWSWNIRADQPNPGMNAIRPTENRLDINDAFVARELAVVFGIEVPTADPSNLELQAFDNPAAVPIGFGATVVAVRGSYNGRMKMTVNTVEFMSGLDLWGFRYVDQAQATATTGAAWRKGLMFRSMVPQIRLQGADKAQFTVELATPQNFGAEAGYRVVAVLLANGMRIANGGGIRPVE